MTDQELNEAIAERLGWEREQRGESYVWIVPYPDGGAVSVRTSLPKWTEDLDATRELVAVIERLGLWNRFALYLEFPSQTPWMRREESCLAIGPTKADEEAGCLRWGMLATARQICESWLETTEGVKL